MKYVSSQGLNFEHYFSEFDTRHGLQICLAIISMGQGAVDVAVLMGLNVMMTLRVYAMYDRSRVVLVFF